MFCPVHGLGAVCTCRYAVALAGAATVLACLPPAEVPEVDPCAAEIVRLEAERTASITESCQGLSYDECMPTIDSITARYDARIQEAIRCGSDR